MKAILKNIIEKRNGLYIHALEVNDLYELKDSIESLVDEFINEYTIKEIIEFIDSLEIYYLGDDQDEEQRIYNLNIVEYIKQSI